MERLTERDDKGNLLFNGKQVYAGDFYEAASCLEEYEDTGLDPDEIRELKERDTAKPLMERHYEEPGEEPYIKYTCPNGCKIQPSRRSKFCGLCGQRLKWEE